MADKFHKITNEDLAGTGNVGQPDTPNLSTMEMQEKFDEVPLDVIVPKFIQLSDELDELDTEELPHSEDITNFKLDDDGKLKETKVESENKIAINN